MVDRLVVKIAFLDVGAGDTIVVSVPDTGEAIVVDCVDSEATFKYLKNESVKYLRGLIVTHLHADHYGGVVQFLDNCEREINCNCEQIIFNWPHDRKYRPDLLQDHDFHSRGLADDKSTKRQTKVLFQRLSKWTNENVHRTNALDAGSTHVGGTIGRVIQVLQPYHGQIGRLEEDGLNNVSGILRINGVRSTALLTGDIEPAGWQELQTRNADLRADVFKFPHHGAWKDADVGALLDVIQPSIVVISVGTESEKYDHPNSLVFLGLRNQPDIRVLCTEATNKCKENALSERVSVVREFERYATNTSSKVIISERGCPCAGTVVVELGDKARVIQPEALFHQKHIIDRHFTNHQCIISTSTL